MHRWTLIALLATGCSSSGNPSVFDDGVTKLIVEIDYAEGAAPYTGSVGTSSDVWNLSQSNLEALIAPTGAALELPHALSDMGEMGAVAGERFDSEAILALSDEHRDVEWDDETATLHAIWLDGYFEDGDGVQESVLGVSIGDTGVVAMFKPVIDGMGGTGPLGDVVQKFGEQTTFIHEIGHAVGLVNNGLPLASDHHDADNGAHCTDDTCVMYWANEGAGDLAEFVSTYVVTGETVVFKDGCLGDAAAAVE